MLAIIAFGLCQWLLPTLAVGHPALEPTAVALRRLGLPVTGLFALLAAVLWFQRRQVAVPSPTIRLGRAEPGLPPSAETNSVALGRMGQSAAPAPEPVDVTWSKVGRRPTCWSLELLQDIEWKRFEELCAAYCREMGWRAETRAYGPDGGIDIRLYDGDASHPKAAAQCKSTEWASVDSVRALCGVMADEKIPRGLFFCSGRIPKRAVAFAEKNSIEPVEGWLFLKKILALPAAGQRHLLAVATEGDFLTPTCVACGAKMALHEVVRDGGNGKVRWRWCCSNLSHRRHELTTRPPSARWRS